jgi:hypothetical protein
MADAEAASAVTPPTLHCELMSDQPKVRELLDRSKLPTREREIKQFRFRLRLHQAASLARARLKSQAREKLRADSDDSTHRT